MGAASDAQTAVLTAVAELDSFDFLRPRKLTGFELPVAYHELDSGYVYVQIYSVFLIMNN